jgi:hypothetical protein
VPESSVSASGASTRETAAGVAADAAPAADFYQTIAEFTERTTNSIGTTSWHHHCNLHPMSYLHRPVDC